MNVRVQSVRRSTTDTSLPVFQCIGCLAYDFSPCQAAAAIAVENTARGKANRHDLAIRTVPARRIICREQDLNDEVPVICNGWAASLVTLSDGSRQILAFLLPGDLVSTTLMFEPRPQCMVEAVTDVSYRTLKRAEFKNLVLKRAELFEAFARAWVEERGRADQLIVDLGRRTADERIAHLILVLAERLAKRGMVQGGKLEMDFPLRQHHIADATGLTPVHVSKVLSEFRRKGLIKISGRSLSILDAAGFRRIANMR